MTGTNPIHLQRIGLLMLYGIWDGVSKHHHHSGGSCQDPRFSARSWKFLLRPVPPVASQLPPPKVPSAPGWAGRHGHEGVKAPPRWPPCFALLRGSRGRLPFASGEAVKVPPPSPGGRSALSGLTAPPPLRVPHFRGR